MSDKKPLGDRIGWFIGYNAARAWDWFIESLNAICSFCSNVFWRIRLFVLDKIGI
jgi:hypothetical protein